MKKNRIIALLVTVIALMGFLTCQEPVGGSSGSESCIVSFDKNDGDSADIAQIQVEKGKTMGSKYPKEPSKNDYQFDGWYDESVKPPIKYESTTKVTKNVVLKAHWTGAKYTITFDKNGGDTDAEPKTIEVIVPNNTITTLPTAPTWIGHTFAGWFDTNAENDGNQFTGVAVNSDITVYARWTIDTNTETETTYTVTFNKNASDATGPSPTSRAVTTPAINIDALPSAPARTGYTFNGWNTQADGSGTVFNQTTSVSANITVHAQWTAHTLSISYANGGGSGSAPTSPSVANYGTTITLPANPYSKTGYTFAGWAVSGTGSVTGTHAEGTSVAVTALSAGITGGNAGITLTAVWTENDVYRVTFNKNASDATDASPTSKTVTYPATTIDALPTAPTRTGYTFAGWNTQADGLGTSFNQTTTVSRNINVYARWTANALAINYADGGGSGSAPTSLSVANYGTSVTMPANPYSKTGYTFAGWAVSGDGSVSGTHAAGASVAVTALSTGINSGGASITLTATWTANTYTVTFNKNAPDGTEPSPANKTVTVPATTVDSLPTAPTRTGYSFAGWNTLANGTGSSFDETTTVSASTTVYAKWTLNTLTIGYAHGDGNGSGLPPTSPTSAAYGTTVILPANTFTRTGYSFAGWAVSGTDSVSGTHGAGEVVAVTALSTGIKTGNASIILTATWTVNIYTVTFNKNASDATEANPASKTVTYSATTIDALPTAPTRTGYTFKEWNTQADGLGTAFNQTTTVSANVTVYAKWTANIYTVTFNKNASDATEASPASKTVTYPATTLDSLPTAPTRAGYAFKEWNTQADGLGTAFNQTATVSANIIVYAKWTANVYTVTFNKNASDATDASPASKTVTYPATTLDSLPTAPTRTGYTFKEWNTQADGLGTAFNQTVTVSANIIVYAKWTANVYTVTFNKNASDATDASPASKTVTYPATTLDSLPTAPTRIGYTFAGWFNTAGDGGNKFTEAATVNGDITVYARWTVNTLVINYAHGGGSGSAPASPSVANYGTNVTMPANPYTYAGHSFAGWAVSGTGSVSGTYAAGTSVAVTVLSTAINTGNADITLTATWTANILSISYANGGGSGSSPTSPSSATYGANVTMPANPYSKTGYTFDGWAVSGTGSLQGTYAAGVSKAVSDLSTGINTGDASITLTATWKGNVYTVTFDKNASDATEADPVTKIVIVPTTNINPLPAAPTRTGYTFTGWKTQPDGSGTTFDETTTISASTTVYAKWTLNTLTIGYANGGGTGSVPTSPTSAAYGTNVTMPANPYTRTGYSFAGWAVSGTDSVSGTHTTGTSVAVTALSTGINTGNASIILTAQWTANVYTVIFNKNASDATDANPASKTVTVPATTIDSLPTAPTRTGYTFKEWNTQSDGSGTAFVRTTTVSANVTVYAQWTVNKSSNANIRAVSEGASGSASSPTGTFGLYIGGIPATSNGTPSTNGTITGTGITNGTIGGNSISTVAGSTVVVIVEDPTVSKVEFGRNGAASNDTAPTSWQNLTKTNDANTPSSLTNKRWVGTLAEANTTGYRFWVRITAEDGATTNIYRYTLTIGQTANYGTLTSLSIGGKSLTGTALGTAAGWWNTTAAPGLAVGAVTLTSGNNVSIDAKWSVGSSGTTTYHYAIIPNTVTMPLKEGDFTGTFTSGNPTTISGLNNGDYILLRVQYTSNNIPILGHCLIKVTIQSAVTPKSTNANIRAVSAGASGNANTPLGTFGLYVGGIPATNNGTPSTNGTITGTGTGAPTNGTIGGNGSSDAQNSSIVVIVEDAAVSKVEFGRNGANSDTTAPTWTNLTKTNDANTPSSLTNKRWVGTLAEANTTNNWRFWVRVTAEDGTTTNIYRYTHNVGGTAGYCALSSLTIGEVTVTTGTTGLNIQGTTAGWWNTTVAPNLTTGNVTLTSGDNVAIAATWSIGSSNASYNYAIIPHTVTWPLKEGDYTPTFTTGNSPSISNLNNGDYILLRAQCTPGSATSVPIVGHYLIKVNIQPPTPIWNITAGPGASYTFSKLVLGYSQQPYGTVTLSNSGNQPTGNLTVSLTGTNSASFEFDSATNTVIGSLAASGLTVGQSVNLLVRPKIGLATGNYNAAISVSGGNSISASYPLNVMVSNLPSAYIGITSDVHYGKNEGSSTAPHIFKTWMTTLKTRYAKLDYMLFCGDNGSAWESGLTFWTNTATLINLADTFVPGFVGGNIFITGNHEWQTAAGGALLDNINKSLTTSVPPYTTVKQVTDRLNIDHSEAARTASYAVYTFGAKPETTPSSTFQGYTPASRATLSAYLASMPTDIPIIIMAHFPLHNFVAGSTGNRNPEYGAETIDLLNQYPNVIFLWGHNHSNSDPMYKTIKGPGYSITTTSGTATNATDHPTKTINFLYVPAGCMRDIEYGQDAANTLNKGVVIEVDGKKLTFRYYDKDCNLVNKSGWDSTVVYNLTSSGYVKQ